MPVYKLRDMPYEELLGWINYFERRPVGWREDDRSAKLLQAWGTKAKPWELFSSLRAIYQEELPLPNEDGLIENRKPKNAKFLGLLSSAVGGEQLKI
jgi:hypothetical protein